MNPVSSLNPAYRRRKRTNAVMMTLATVALAFGLFWLLWILGVLLWEGFNGLSLKVFTQMTPPPGSDGPGRGSRRRAGPVRARLLH